LKASPLNVVAVQWSEVYDGETSEKVAETYRRSIIDCCAAGSLADPFATPANISRSPGLGAGAVWGYSDSDACQAPSMPQCSPKWLHDDLYKDTHPTHSFTCAYCLSCCSAMTYHADGSFQPRRYRCWYDAKEFAEQGTDKQEDEGLLRVRLTVDYDWWEDPTTSGYFWPIFLGILTGMWGVACCCLITILIDHSW
jgi:hypothetical protein